VVEERESVVCLYCGQLRPWSRTHIIPRALGGDLTSRTNCQECNWRTGVLDQALAERAITSLSRVARTPKTGFTVALGGDAFFESPEGVVCELRVRNEMSPEVLPQVHARPSTDTGKTELATTAGTSDGLIALLDFVEEAIESDTLRSLHIKSGPAKAGPDPRLVLHRPSVPAGFVRVQNPGDEELLFDALERGWHEVCRAHREQLEEGSLRGVAHERPRVDVTMSLSLDDEYRAVARIAFDYLASRIGSEPLRGDDFAPLRNYILGDVQHPPRNPRPGEVFYDPRFVRRLDTGGLRTDGHCILVCRVGPEVVGIVTLYSRSSFFVRLAKTQTNLDLPMAHEFSLDREGNRQLTIQEIAQLIDEGGLPPL